MHLPNRWLMISSILLLSITALFIVDIWYGNVIPYPFGQIAIAIGIAVLIWGWSLMRLRTATGYRRIPRIVNMIATSLLVLAVVFSSLNLLAVSANQPANYPYPFWLLPVALILTIGTNLVESGWDKPSMQAWLHIIGAAVVSGIVLFGVLLVWLSLAR
jgi:hypothetical protein